MWWRRPKRHVPAWEIEAAEVVQFCLDESRALFEGWIHSLGNRVINPLRAEMAANQKPFQLYTAERVGLRIPRTICSNSPERVLKFVKQLEGPAVFKTFTTLKWRMCETREINEDMLAILPSLCHSPAIFQERIRKKEDIRVTIVDREFFPVFVHTDHSEARLDWRLDVAATVSPCVLPDDLKERLFALMSNLGLRFGAVDLALDEDDQYVFFEVNPGGQYLWTEIQGDQPVSAALAAALGTIPASEE